MSQLIEFRSFQPIHGIISIPANTLLMRGYHTGYPAVSNRPAYFTSYKEIVNTYAIQNQHTFGYFKTTTELKLLDLRYIKLLLKDFFDAQMSNIMSQHPNVADCMLSITLALGLCSSIIQMNLLKRRYLDSNNSKDINARLSNMNAYFSSPNIFNPIDPQGIRIAETTNDNLMILCLREIFGNSIHGYIMPDVFSPYHIEKANYILNAEIVIFNPLNAHIQLLNVKKEPDISKMERIDLQERYKYEPYKVLGLSYINMNPIEVVIKGGASSENLNSNPNTFFDLGGPPYQTLLKYARRAMRILLKKDRPKKSKMVIGGDAGSYPNFVKNPTHTVKPFNLTEINAFLETRIKNLC